MHVEALQHFFLPPNQWSKIQVAQLGKAVCIAVWIAVWIRGSSPDEHLCKPKKEALFWAKNPNICGKRALLHSGPRKNPYGQREWTLG